MKLALHLVLLLFLACWSCSAQVPYPFTLNSQDPATPSLTVYQANQAKFRVTYKDGTNGTDLTSLSPYMFWAASDYSTNVVLSDITMVTTNPGVVDFLFTASDLNYSGGVRGVYGVGIQQYPQTYRIGKFTIKPDPYATGAGPISYGLVLNWALYTQYLGTASSGPYRAGTNIGFRAGAYGEVYIDFTGTVTAAVSPTVSLTGGTTVEKGSTVANPAVTWDVNETMTNITLSGPGLASTNVTGVGGDDSYTDTGRNLTTNGTYSIIVYDSDGNSASDTTSWTFTNRRYMGESTNRIPSNAELLAMNVSWQAKGGSGAASPSGEYIIVAYPATLGACSSFVLGGFSTDPWPLGTNSVTNASGFAESYLIYSSDNLLTSGAITYDLD